MKASTATLTPGPIEIRIFRDGKRVFTATTEERLPIYNKKTRCQNCHSGIAFALVNPDGTIKPRGPI